MYRVLVDITIIGHMAFIFFVVAGGFLMRVDRRFAWIHLPALLWAVFAELSPGIACPLTTLENFFALRAGLATYEEDFIARYLVPVIYQEGMTRMWQYVLVAAVLAVNCFAYGWRKKKPNQAPEPT